MLALERLGIAKRSIRPNSTLHWFSAYDANIIGGAMVGIGMSLTGACPGTVLVQLAHQVPSSNATALGALLGGIFYAGFGERLKLKRPAASAHPEPRYQTVDAKFGLDPVAAFRVFEILLLATITISSLAFPGRSLALIVPVAGGCLIGIAQALSILLTSKPIGVSTAYEQLGRWVCRAFQSSKFFQPTDSAASLWFALGVLSGSLAFALQMKHQLPTHTRQLSVGQALVGGCIMTFGARLAGGCTSGHGISGLSAFSFSSLVTVLAMFGAGIGFATLGF